MVIDQLEEVFTVCESEAERAEFLNLVGTLAANAGPGSALVVLGMRADFYGTASQYPVLRQSMQSRQVVLGALTAAEVRGAIAGPALAAGLTLEPGLTEILLHDLGVDESADDSGGAGSYEPGRLPLLAHALRAIWQNRSGSRLTIAGYRVSGGIAGAIAKTANDVYGGLDASRQARPAAPAPAGFEESRQAEARRLFLSLIRVGKPTGEGDAGVDTRRRVAPGSLLAQAANPVAAREVLEAFTAARLLTSGEQAVEITHEALLREWPLLREWIDEARAGLLVRQELEASAADWASRGKDADALYRGVRLAAAQEWAANSGHSRELTPGGRDFLAAAERFRRRGLRRRNGTIAVLVALSLVLASLSVFALGQRDAARVNLAHAEAGLLAAESGQAWADFRPDTAQEFATEAYRQYPSSPQVRDALLSTQALPITGRLLINGTFENGNLVGVAFNPAGTIIAGTTSDGYVQLWSASTYRLLWQFSSRRLTTATSRSTPSRSARTGGSWPSPILAAPGCSTSPIRPTQSTWPPCTCRPSRAARTCRWPASPSVPTGRRSRRASRFPARSRPSGFVLLWNVSTGALLGTIPEPYVANSLAFTPNGQSLVTGTATGAVDLWNVARRVKTAELQAPTSATIADESPIAVSPNGQLIAFGTQTGENAYAAKLWSMAAGKVIATVPSGPDSLSSIAFSPNGTQLAASDLGGAVRLWDVTRPSALLLGTFSGHRSPVEHIAFSPDGDTLASASDDGTIALWSTRGTLLGGLANPSIAVAFSPDGRTLALSTHDASGNVIALYAMPARTLIRELPVPGLAALAFSPDGQTLVVAPRTPSLGPVEVWNVATWKETGTFQTGLVSSVKGTATGINSIAFSPDGTMLAVSATQSTTIQVWSTATLTRIASFLDTQQTSYPASLGGGVFQLSFSPNGRLLAAVGIDDFIRVYSVPGFSLVDVFEGLDSMDAVAFSPNGQLLALGNAAGDVYLFAVPPVVKNNNLGGQTELGAFAASSKTIWSVQFLSNTMLIAGGTDGVARFWTVPPGKNWNDSIPVQAVATHAGLIGAMSYSAPLGLLATGSPSGSRVWQTNPAQVATSICQSLKAPVGQSLWSDYLPGIPYVPVC